MDPAKMKVVDLRSELGALGLDTKGNKPALVERLKKALESKTGRAIADTTILDTSTEDADEVATPKRPGPASRTTRRASSSRMAGTPAKTLEEDEEQTPRVPAARTTRRSSSSRLADAPIKQPREETPEVIEEDMAEEEEPTPVEAPKPVPAPQPVPRPVSPPREPPEASVKPSPAKPVSDGDDMYVVDDEKSQSPIQVKEDVENEDEPMEPPADKSEKNDVEKMEEEESGKKADDREEAAKEKDENRPLTEEEEWEKMNERLKVKEQERIELEKQVAEEQAKKLEEISQNPRKLQRLKYKQGKRARWSNYYGGVETTGDVLTPPEESVKTPGKKDAAASNKISEPDLNDDKVTLSWYDSDLNQYLEVPELSSVVPLSDGAFSFAWAGARGSHGVSRGRVCFELRVGAVVTTTEMAEKDPVAAGLRMGWSTDDSSLHLGDGEQSWGFDSSARAVNNGEFKEFGRQINEKDVVGVYLDLESNPCKISYTVNGDELGVAYEFERESLGDKALFPHVLTKNMCYKVNFGYERYNMLTKTKILRTLEKIPVEQAIEEKKAIEDEIQRKKEESAKRERERRERERKEREDRQRKKREEKERLEKERKEKEAQERKERGEEEKPEEEEKMEEDNKEKGEKENDKEKEAEPKENGESEKATEVKEEPMETEQSAPAQPEAEPAAEPGAPAKDAQDVKDEPASQSSADDADVMTMEQFMNTPVLDKKIKFIRRFTSTEELDGAEGCLLPGYVLIAHAELVPGPRRPASVADCEVILMVGMPGSGKTYWAKQHVAANPDKRYNILSTGALFDKMKVDCKPFRSSYEGRWDAMVSKCAKCVLRLLEIAKGRRRNFILDQTNVYPSAQRRKLREFDGYRRVAVVVISDDDTYRERTKRREEADGKEVPDGAIVDMKANFTLPEAGPWLDEVIYPELDEEEARKVVDTFHKEAKAAGVGKDKRDRSGSRDGGPPGKRQRDDRPRHRDDRRGRDGGGRDREDRWGGGGGRWGPASRGGGGAGGRWGRDARPPGGPPQGRFDRWGPPARGNDFGGRGDRDSFRGGRGGPGGGRGERPPGPPHARAPQADQSRFSRDNRSSRPPQDKRPGNGGPPGAGGGAGGWQRGGGGRGGAQPRMPKDGQNQMAQNQNAQNQQGWNQWASGWGGWGNWNQNQAGWGNWGNWGNWNQGNQQQGGNQQSGAGNKGGNQQQQQQQQWPANYTAQQWYQWQQWQQQQQQQWPGYQQGNQQQAGNTPDAQAWAQYYQNYSGANASTNAAVTEKK